MAPLRACGEAGVEQEDQPSEAPRDDDSEDGPCERADGPVERGIRPPVERGIGLDACLPDGLLSHEPHRLRLPGSESNPSQLAKSSKKRSLEYWARHPLGPLYRPASSPR